jgi:hypothetical protein
MFEIDDDETQVAVRINEGKLLQNLRYAFSNRYTIVSELMQNARRAGARYVVVEYDAKAETLMVRDDGCGIEDFQTLFTFGESGWDASLVASETAFGLGFTKSLYAAKTCTVLSRGRAISFETAEALAQQPIAVKSVPTSSETTVILGGVALPEIDQRIVSLASGFPIPVIYNGAEQARTFAVDRMQTIDTAVGRVYLRGLADGKKPSTSSVLFLQGFRVDGKLHYADTENIVHLDPTQFPARLPDRDELIDADEQRRRVEKALKEVWRAKLLREKQQLTAARFVDDYFEAAKVWHLLDLFDDVPALPGSHFDVVSDYPYQEGYGDADYRTHLDRLVTQAEIASGQTVIVDLDSPCEENMAHWMFARACGWHVFGEPGLSKTHWIRLFVKPLEGLSCEVRIEEERVRAALEGTFVWPTVVMCKSYVIRLNGAEVRIANEALYWHEQDVLIVPDGESSGLGVRQVSSFIGENDHWHEEDQEHDQQALEDLIRLLRATDPLTTLDSLLSELHLERYPALWGKTFRLQVAKDAQQRVLELLK